MGKTPRKITWIVSEDRIEKAVVDHFENLGFVTKRQHTIQIGSRVGRADVVVYKTTVQGLQVNLVDIAAIIECKAPGKVGHGVPQLHSYLCATDTRLGVFANSLFFHDWKYYENHGGNDIPENKPQSIFKYLER